MALPSHALVKLAPYMRKAKILSLGYPDILVKPEEVEKLFGYKPTKFTDQKWHGVEEKCPNSLELFKQLESQVTIVDFAKVVGMETVADLNYPHDFGKFDLVIDPGTIEHCFNIGQALLNAANAVRAGGVIFHISPMTMLNHGFYNLNPTLFYDFYIQNGWDILELKILPFRTPTISVTGRFDVHTEHLIRVLAKRKTEDPLKMPIQTKYLEKMAAEKEKK